ncbi:IclR family transcriptional regulator [Arthrobacter sp. ISL-30]|uniref:IclR family transcriptional regulator n=1 Tax=Arthrobacter sp. ISL-30 TaxID=2819109 RepID=UPI001BEC39C1|nr:IclR family transcriptional regulator [Arthrobacter sp. ISL-30]MBT2514676.1 IclR family transcriptional regulator [Arthrobacter sp. ISL-30]
MLRNEESSRVEAVHRALVLLKMMAENGSISVTEAAKELDVNPSTAQRLLATLVGDGFARQGVQKRYSPGPEFLRPGMMQPVPPLRLRARPYLERLFERVGETVHLATLVGTEIHHLDGIEATTQPLRFGLRTGVTLPAHVTSAGKAMLADLTPEEVEARYKIAAVGPGRGNAKVDLARIQRELEKTRRLGVGTNYEESEDGVAALAVSLGVIDGEHAAFSIALPSARFTREDAKRLASSLVQTAKEFSEHEISAPAK